MHHYKWKTVMLLLLSQIIVVPIPTATPSLAEAQGELDKAAQSLSIMRDTLSTFTPLMIIALGLLCVFAGILILGRKKSDIQPLINSQQKLLDALMTRDNDREDKHQESIEALAIVNQEVKAIVTTLNTRDMQQSALIERMVSNAEHQTSALEIMVTKGSAPVQNMAAEIASMRHDGIKPDKSAQEQLDRIETIAKEINQKAKDCRETDEVLAASMPANELLLEVNRNLELFKRWLESGIEEVIKRKGDSKPIPPIVVDPPAESDALPKAS